MTVIAACTNKKKLPACDKLRIDNYQAESLPILAFIWNRALNEVESVRLPAIELYIGDHAQSIRQLRQLLVENGENTRLYYLSAGYGFLACDSKIKPYSATFANGTRDSISDRIRGLVKTPIDMRVWVENLHNRMPNPEKMDLPIVVIASRSYLDAFRIDLTKIVSTLKTPTDFLVVTSSPPAWLKELGVEPLETFQAMRLIVGGSLLSLNARVGLSLFKDGPASSQEVRNRYERLTRNCVPIPPLPKRSKPTEKQIRQFIAEYQKKNSRPTKSRALRELRDSKHWQCEQARFSDLFFKMSEGKNGHK